VSAGQVPAATRAILLDIEGTTTPIAFVFDVLFPYVRTQLRSHLRRHAGSPEYAALLERLREEHAADSSSRDVPPPLESSPGDALLESIARYVEWLMDRDRKSTPLKELQGLIWEEGYARTDLSAETFADVPAALERWRTSQLRVGIYSSGSVRAQQLLFRHSSAGDLTRFITHYFDTTSGPKSDSGSYRRIASAMEIPPPAIVFVSDAVRELDAARAAGMQTRLAVRPGNPAAAPGHGHAAIDTFDELAVE
jgi:enolase-phosphatase E1